MNFKRKIRMIILGVIFIVGVGGAFLNIVGVGGVFLNIAGVSSGLFCLHWKNQSKGDYTPRDIEYLIFGLSWALFLNHQYGGWGCIPAFNLGYFLDKLILLKEKS